MYLNPLKINFK